jgi:hypothetical protein
MKHILILIFLSYLSCSKSNPTPVVTPPIETNPVIVPEHGVNVFEGTKIIWVGTSIPAAYSPDDYPSQIGKGLGATVINNSILGSGIMCWQTKGDTLARPGLAGTFQQNIVTGAGQNHSYEFNIMYFMEGVQTVVIDHGTNDNLLLPQRTGTPDSRDIGTFYGSYNVIIDAVLAKYPNTRIVLCTPPNGYIPLNLTGLQIVRNVILDIGKKRNLAVWDMMTRSGITKDNVSKKTNDNVHPNKATTDSLAIDGIKFFKSLK